MQYDISSLDCDRMAIHPQNPQLVNYMDSKLPVAGRVSSTNWKKGFTKAMVYRYVLLMYDKDSPIQEMHSLDWYGKKFESVAYAGFELKKSRDGHYRFNDAVLEMVLGKNDDVTDIIISFLGFQNNHKWNHLVYLHESLMHYVKDALSGKEQESRDRKEVRLVYDEIEKVSQDMGHVYEETEDFVDRFYYQIEASRLSIKPEDYARALADGVDLRGDNPYGVGYVVDKISFVGDELPDDA